MSSDSHDQLDTNGELGRRIPITEVIALLHKAATAMRQNLGILERRADQHDWTGSEQAAAIIRNDAALIHASMVALDALNIARAGTASCHWCNQPLTYHPQHGWCHQAGSSNVLECERKRGGCGHRWSPPPQATPGNDPDAHRAYWTCPACANIDPTCDHHTALPAEHARLLGIPR